MKSGMKSKKSVTTIIGVSLLLGSVIIWKAREKKRYLSSDVSPGPPGYLRRGTGVSWVIRRFLWTALF